jgi:hypothetical protein
MAKTKKVEHSKKEKVHIIKDKPVKKAAVEIPPEKPPKSDKSKSKKS